MIKYNKLNTTLASWMYIIKDLEWYIAVDINEIHWRMSLQYDIEEQSIDPNDCIISDDVIPEKIRPISPVLLSELWHPETLFDIKTGSKGVKYLNAEMPQICHIVNGIRNTPKNKFDNRMVKMLSICEKEYKDCVIGMHHAVGWLYDKKFELLPLYRKNCRINKYIWDKRLV